MGAESPKPKKQSENQSYHEPNGSPELEKKVDQLLSLDTIVEEPTFTELDVPETVPEPELPGQEAKPLSWTDKTPFVPVDEPAGVPLLPTEELPDLEKHTPEPKPPLVVPEEELMEDEPLEAFEPPAEPEPVPERPAIAEPPAIKPVYDDLGLDDASTSKAVDEIIASESDELLAARDARTSSDRQLMKIPKKKLPKAVKIGIFVVVLVVIAAIAIVPTSRYFILNTVGVRSASSVNVYDLSTNQPLKNAEFTIAGVSAKTDSEGNATVNNLKLGPSKFTIKKPAFADISKDQTVGWGSNPLGQFKLKAVGSQVSFTVVDFVSKKPITKAEATSGPANSRANEAGKVTLTLPQTDADTITIAVSAEGFRTEKMAVSFDTKLENTVALVPDRKQPFISKRDGTFDLYSTDIDGKNEKKILAGTGRERSELIALAPHPSRELAALVSNRESGNNSPATLTMVDLKSNATSTVTTSPRIQLVDWIGNKLIYVKIGDKEAEDSTKRHRLISYDIDSKKESELASTNYFNDVMVANNSIYYSPALYQINGTVGLYKINADGNVKKTVFDKEVWNLFRTGYDTVAVSLGQEYYNLALASDVMTKANGAPPTQKSRVYFDSPDNSKSLWVEDRDGKGTLLAYDTAKKNDNVVQARSGLKYPVRWLNDTTIVYRSSSGQETADYVVSTLGGEPIKIRDVTDTAGIDKWYYY